MATGISYRQDMPPEGGFKPIDFTKQVNYKKTNGLKLFGIVCGFQFLGYLYVQYQLKRRLSNVREEQDARMVEGVFRLAETDRMYLKHLRVLRDEERELMKDVPGWEVGTLFGEPVFHKEKRQFVMPTAEDDSAFTSTRLNYFYERFLSKSHK